MPERKPEEASVFVALSREQKERLYENACQLISERRRDLFDRLSALRTRHISVVLEDVYQSHNAAAVLRSCDCFGVQDVHVVEGRNAFNPAGDVAVGSSKWVDYYRYQNIRDAYARIHAQGVHGRIIIFGQVGHAEVLGLVGQVNGDALVVENSQMLEEAMPHLDFSQPIEIFSQTTKSPREYKLICDMLQARGARLTVHNTICGQVSSRHEKLVQFAESHDIIIFVTGKESSNGKILSALCRSVNPRTYVIGRINEIDPAWFQEGDQVGICGATSTPKWALEAVARDIEKLDCAKN